MASVSPKLYVAEGVGAPGFDEREVGGDRFLHDVVDAVEDARFFRLAGDGYLAALGVLDRGAAGLDEGTVAGWCVESGDARTARSDPLRQRPLGNKLELQTAR